ncbi:MAG: type II toxin-antitoxin system VapC family toxin [Actinomycetota bacterium]
MNSAAYLDASAITKLFIPEKDSEIAEEIIYSFEEVFTSRVSTVEVQRAIALFYDGANRDSWITSFRRWLEDVTVIDVSRDIVNLATAVNQNGALKALDAIHVATAQALGGSDLAFVTFDKKQGKFAELIGMQVQGC